MDHHSTNLEKTITAMAGLSKTYIMAQDAREEKLANANKEFMYYVKEKIVDKLDKQRETPEETKKVQAFLLNETGRTKEEALEWAKEAIPKKKRGKGDKIGITAKIEFKTANEIFLWEVLKMTQPHCIEFLENVYQVFKENSQGIVVSEIAEEFHTWQADFVGKYEKDLKRRVKICPEAVLEDQAKQVGHSSKSIAKAAIRQKQIEQDKEILKETGAIENDSDSDAMETDPKKLKQEDDEDAEEPAHSDTEEGKEREESLKKKTKALKKSSTASVVLSEDEFDPLPVQQPVIVPPKPKSPEMKILKSNPDGYPTYHNGQGNTTKVHLATPEAIKSAKSDKKKHTTDTTKKRSSTETTTTKSSSKKPKVDLSMPTAPIIKPSPDLYPRPCSRTACKGKIQEKGNYCTQCGLNKDLMSKSEVSSTKK